MSGKREKKTRKEIKNLLAINGAELEIKFQFQNDGNDDDSNDVECYFLSIKTAI
jgi:hypothetical protein